MAFFIYSSACDVVKNHNNGGYTILIKNATRITKMIKNLKTSKKKNTKSEYIVNK